MRGYPKCFGNVRKFYPEVLSLERTENGIFIRMSVDGYPCARCMKRRACFAVVFKNEVKSILEKRVRVG